MATAFRDLSDKYKLGVRPVTTWRRGFVCLSTKKNQLGAARWWILNPKLDTAQSLLLAGGLDRQWRG